MRVNMRRWRVERGLSQSDITRLINEHLEKSILPTSYAGIERGDRLPSATVLLAMCKVIGLDAPMLLAQCEGQEEPLNKSN